ncbi:MAG TPA: hypothetical protein VMQ62_07345, partial [Dongiaceae bacterium]|nr:hypothetical protein [Dongiaceae bacterium]
MTRRVIDLGLAAALVFVVANSSYLAAFDTASIAYHVMVVAHLVAGIVLAALVALRGLPILARRLRGGGAFRGTLLVVAALAGFVSLGTALRLAATGTATPYRTLLTVHIAASVLTLGAAAAAWVLAGGGVLARRAAWGLLIAILFPIAMRGYDQVRPAHVAVIVNPTTAPLTPDDEGGGKGSPFFPSSVTTVGNRFVPEDFFLESKACGNKGCHPDIT